MALHGQYIRRVVCKACSIYLANESNLRIHYEREHPKKRVPKKLRYTTVPNKCKCIGFVSPVLLLDTVTVEPNCFSLPDPYRANIEVNDSFTLNEPNERDDNSDLNSDVDGDAAGGVGAANQVPQDQNSSEVASGGLSIADPIHFARLLVHLHTVSARAHLSRPETSTDDTDSFSGFGPVDDAPLNLVWKPITPA